MIIESIISGIMPVGLLILSEKMISAIELKEVGSNQIIILVISLTLFGVACEVLLQYTRMKIENYNIQFGSFIQAKILKKVAFLNSKDFEKSNIYDLISRTQYDAVSGLLGNIKTLNSIITLLVGLISYSIIIVKYDIRILLIAMILPIIRFVFERKVGIIEYNLIRENTEEERKGNYLFSLLTNAEEHKEIKQYKLFGYFIDEFVRVKKTYNKKLMNLNRKKAGIYSIIIIGEEIIDFIITLLLAIQTFMGTLLIGEFILYNNAVISLKQNAVAMFSQLSLMYKNNMMTEQFKEFCDLKNEDLNEEGLKIDKITNIQLVNVCYRYIGQERNTLSNINLTLKSGEFIILMGYNGSGKSTLMKIIMGIYHDYSGTILVNGIDLKKINIDSYRKEVSVLFQDYIKYEASITENVGYGNIKEVNNISKIKKYLEDVFLIKFCNNMDKKLGYMFSEGQQISMGQWQKIALARALIKESTLYIFDEPNASLDLESEVGIIERIYSELNDNIMVLISHKFNVVFKKADKIIVLHQGEILEQGVHLELLKTDGIYKKLYTLYKSI